MAHRGSFRRRSGGISESNRRKKRWSPFFAPAASEDVLTTGDFSPTLNFQLSIGIGAASPQQRSLAYVFSAGGLTDDVNPESTIIRIRGSLELQKNVVSTADIETFAFGIGVMETQAALLGAFPNPASPLGSEWDGWMMYRSNSQGALDANAGIVDVKAMRKVQSGYSLVLVMG